MRFKRKKGDEEEVVSGDVVGEDAPRSTWATPAPADADVAGDDVQQDTVDMNAVEPATAAGGADRGLDDHGERTDDSSTTILEQATEGLEPGAFAEHAAPAVESEATAEHAPVADPAPEVEEPAATALSGPSEPQVEPEPAPAAPPEPSTTVSGASFVAPGLGSDVEPRAAAAANQPASASSSFSRPAEDKPKPKPAADSEAGGASEAGPLAPVLNHPAVQKKPELLIAGGVAAGFVLAKLLKVIGPSDK